MANSNSNNVHNIHSKTYSDKKNNKNKKNVPYATWEILNCAYALLTAIHTTTAVKQRKFYFWFPLPLCSLFLSASISNIIQPKRDVWWFWLWNSCQRNFKSSHSPFGESIHHSCIQNTQGFSIISGNECVPSTNKLNLIRPKKKNATNHVAFRC